ncbi:hypothetical protein FSOLCH5_001970 [Fusarium solani]|jgi:hypothetical protein
MKPYGPSMIVRMSVAVVCMYARRNTGVGDARYRYPPMFACPMPRGFQKLSSSPCFRPASILGPSRQLFECRLRHAPRGRGRSLTLLPSLTHGATSQIKGMGSSGARTQPSSLTLQVHRAPRATGNGADKINLALLLANGMEFSSPNASRHAKKLWLLNSACFDAWSETRKGEAQRTTFRAPFLV